MRNNLVFLSLVAPVLFHGCFKKLDCRGTIHDFEAFYKAYPAKDSIRVNDTIWIELTTPTQLQDMNTGRLVNYSNAANFGVVLSYIQLTGGDMLNTGALPAANEFDNVLINGTLVTPLRPDQLREFRVEEKNGMYLLKVGVVPKKTGLYFIGPSNSTNVYQKGNSCDKSNFNLTFKETNQHIYLLEQSRPGYSVSSYEKGHAYVFKVY